MNQNNNMLSCLAIRALLAVATSLGLVVSGGCVTESGDCPVETKSRGIAVSLAISGGLPKITKALDEVDGTIAESYIDINDLYILTFENGSGDVVDGNSKLMEIIWSPDVAQRIPESVIITKDNSTVVELRTFLNSDPNGTGEDIYKDQQGNYKKFSIVAIANASRWIEGKMPTLSKGITTLANLQQVLKYGDSIVGYGGENISAWTPTVATPMPLFGILRVDLTGYDPDLFSKANPFWLDTVWLLRTLAKVQISTSADSGLTITSASVVGGGWNKEVTLIPFLSDGNNPPAYNLSCMEDFSKTGNTGQLVKSPSYESSLAVESQSLPFNVSNGVATVYLPEYFLDRTETPGKRILEVRFKEFTDDPYYISISPYNEADGQPVVPGNDEIWWHYILRNYLYRFHIIEINIDQTLSLKYTVCPMMKYETDIPAFQ